MDHNPPEIKVTENGGYEVTGDLPITPKRMVLSEEGESLTWATSEPIPHTSPTRLCRCGHSNNKPFCDGSHERVGFDGTETASTQSYDEMRKSYQGEGLTVHRVGSICQHASFCANAVTDWYQMLPDTGDVNIKTQVIGMIEHCPSGALVYELAGEIVEADLPQAISPVEDGPYWVTGGVKIIRSDGIELEPRNRVTLCRCGASKNKPLCDGTHFEIGFEAKNPETASTQHGGSAGETESDGADAASGLVRHIVVGVGDRLSEEACSVAASIAAKAGSRLTLVHVGSDGGEAKGLLAAAATIVSRGGVGPDSLSFERLSGRSAPALARFAEDADAGLIVLGRGGEHMGHVPHQIAYQSPCDVLLVAGRHERPTRYRRILIATDGSATADRAARRGFDMARAVGAKVDIVFVGHPATGALVVEDTISLFGSGVEVRTWLLEGIPTARILETIDSSGADLDVIGNKGLTKTKSLFRRSVPGGVLAGAHCDVLLSRTVRQLESELKPGEGGVIERHGEPIAAYLDEAGKLHLMSAVCTHLGCTVAWDPAAGNFECPCHGSRFGPTGEVVDGPASRPLKRV